MPAIRTGARIAIVLALGASTLAVLAPVAAVAGVDQARSQRLDPYRNFRFRVVFDGHTVAGADRVTLPAQPAVIEHRSGGDPSTSLKAPGRSRYEPVVLERGLTQDMGFARWAAQTTGLHIRRDLRLEAYDDAGRLIGAWRLRNCWVSEYNALPNLEAGAAAVSIQHIRLENEGFERDAA